jgi:hypothetical protein
MSILRLMPAEDSKSKALPIVAVAVAAVMAFALFGLPSLASDVDTSATIDSTTPASSPATTEEQVECQRVGETLCIYLEDEWKAGKAGDAFANWVYTFSTNNTGVTAAGLYMHDLTPVVSTKEALDWWIGQCAGYECADFEALATDTETRTITLVDGTQAIIQFTGYTVNNATTPDVIQFGQSVALLSRTQNASVVIVDLTFVASVDQLYALSETELEQFYTDIDKYFWTLIQERLAVVGS